MTPTKIILHYEGHAPNKEPATFWAVNNYHRTLGFPESSLGFSLGYSYWIELNGVVLQARLDGEITAHTIGHNDGSAIGICWAGNKPTLAQELALKNLLIRLVDKYQIKLNNIGPHRQFQANRICFGNLPNDYGRHFVREYLGQKINLLEKLINSYQEFLRLLQPQKLGGTEVCWLNNFTDGQEKKGLSL